MHANLWPCLPLSIINTEKGGRKIRLKRRSWDLLEIVSESHYLFKRSRADHGWDDDDLLSLSCLRNGIGHYSIDMCDYKVFINLHVNLLATSIITYPHHKIKQTLSFLNHHLLLPNPQTSLLIYQTQVSSISITK